MQNCQNESNEINDDYMNSNVNLNHQSINASNLLNANTICLTNNNSTNSNQNSGACYLVRNGLLQFPNDSTASSTFTELQPVYTQLPSIDTLGNKSNFK